MKHILVILAFFLCSLVGIASDTTIVFQPINYADLFEVAKKDNKGIMLYFHFDGCGACGKMENTAFKDKRVIDFYNTNFINFDINTEEEEGMEANKNYNIQVQPTFIFFDAVGNELHRIVGAFSPEDFYRHAKDALTTQNNLTNYKIKYKEGNRAPDFLFDYAYMLRDAIELDSAVVNQYLDVIATTDYKLEKNIKFIYEFCIHNFKVFIPSNNPRFKFLLDNKDLFYQQIDSNQVKARIIWIINTSVYKAIEEQDEHSFKLALNLLKDFDDGEQYLFKERDGRVTGMISSKNLVLSSKLSYYTKSGDQPNYLKTLDIYLSKIWNDTDELNSFAWNVFEQANNEESEKISTAIKCSIRSIELKDSYANNDTYAWLLYKSSDIKRAKKQANKTIEIAKKTNQDYSETQKLLDIIKKK